MNHARASTLVAEGTKLAHGGLCALRRIHQLLGRPEVEPLAQVTRVLESNDAPTWVKALAIRPGLVVGDFVLARGFLGEVVEERTSPFRNRSLRVRFLAERPLPELEVDWFRVREVVPLFSKERMRQQVSEKIAGDAHDVDDEVLRQSVVPYGKAAYARRCGRRRA